MEKLKLKLRNFQLVIQNNSNSILSKYFEELKLRTIKSQFDTNIYNLKVQRTIYIKGSHCKDIWTFI